MSGREARAPVIEQLRLSRSYSAGTTATNHNDTMDTEESKVWLTGSGSLKGDCLERMQTFVFLCTTTLQNPRAPRGFYGRTDGQFRPPPFRPCRFPCPKFPCPIRPHSRTAASRPSRWASAVRLRGLALGSFPLCVPSDLCGVPLRAPTIGALPENTAEIGKNAERDKGGSARTAYSLRRSSEFYTTPLPPHARRRGPVTLLGLRLRRPVFIVSLWLSSPFQLNRNSSDRHATPSPLGVLPIAAVF